MGTRLIEQDGCPCNLFFKKFHLKCGPKWLWFKDRIGPLFAKLRRPSGDGQLEARSHAVSY